MRPERKLWAYWEMPPGVRELPPHIAICRRIMKRKAVGYTLNVVTPENAHRYLPDLPKRLMRIALAPRGRIDEYFRRRKRRAAAIPLRADYIRAFLLERYGGLYIDSDAVIIGDLMPIFDEIENAGFVIVRRETFGRDNVSVSFYGSAAHGPIISEYSNALRARLSGNLDYHYNEVGASMLTPIVNKQLRNVTILPERNIQPITFEEADAKFTSTNIQLADVISRETKVFMLHSGPFKGPLAGLSEEEMLQSDRLISKVFRYALGESKECDLLTRRP
jgi:mannosyltransferase OCH1-like enzyme